MTNSVFHLHALKIAHLSHLAQRLLKDLYTIPQLFYLEYHTRKPSSTLWTFPFYPLTEIKKQM